MIEPVSSEELERLLEPIPEAGKGLIAGGIGWPVVIDYQTLCARLVSLGFSKGRLAMVKGAVLEAELAYRYCGAVRMKQC